MLMKTQSVNVTLPEAQITGLLAPIYLWDTFGKEKQFIMSQANCNNNNDEPKPEVFNSKSTEDMKKLMPPVGQLTDRFGNTFHFGNAGDYWHPPFPVGAHTDYRTHARKIRDMEIRRDDVLICSFPKTGLHWTQEIVNMLLHKTSEHFKDQKSFMGFIDMFPTEALDKLPSPRLLFTHVPFRYVPKQAFEKKIKIINLDRNPKDVLVSYYNHIHSHVVPLTYPGTFEQFFYLYFECGFYYGDIFDYLLDWQNGKEAHPDVDIFTCVFEEMKADPVGGVKKLNVYLGTCCSDELCEQIAIACSFKNLKAFKDANAPEAVKLMFKNSTQAFYRKGDVGDWKNWFTVAMNERFEKEFKRRMAGYKTQYKYTL